MPNNIALFDKTIVARKDKWKNTGVNPPALTPKEKI